MRRTKTLEPIREVAFRDPTRATVAIVVTGDETDLSMELITVTRQTPVLQTVRRPTTTLWVDGDRGGSAWLGLADSGLFWPIDSVASVVFFPVAILSSEYHVRYGPLALVMAVALPYCSLIPADVQEPHAWEFEVAARKGIDITFERLPNESAVETEALANELVVIECEGTRTELRTSLSGTVRFPKETYVRLARGLNKRTTTLTVSAAGAVLTVPIEETDLISAD